MSSRFSHQAKKDGEFVLLLVTVSYNKTIIILCSTAKIHDSNGFMTRQMAAFDWQLRTVNANGGFQKQGALLTGVRIIRITTYWDRYWDSRNF